MIIKYYKDYIEHINEGLIKTYPGDIVSKNLTDQLVGLNISFNIDFLEKFNKIKLTFNYFNSIPVYNLDNLFDIINTFIINKGGWFPSQMNITNIYGMKNSTRYNIKDLYENHSIYTNIDILYESKFDDEVKEIPEKLYHLSIYEYKDKISKYGLVPKSKDKLTSHLDRIYLCSDIDDCKRLISRMKLYYNDEKLFNVYNKDKRKYNKNTIPIIFEIDNSKHFIKKLYKDPNYEHGFYTLDNIPPNKLSIK